MLPELATYDALAAAFRWAIPDRFNIGVACCDAWAAAEPDRVALMELSGDGAITTTSYGALQDRARSEEHTSELQSL